MEYFKSNLLIIFPLTLFSLFWLSKIYYNSKNKIHKLVPPGPWKLPIIGNLHQLASAGLTPHRTFRNLSNKYGPIMHLQQGQISTIVISSPDFAKEVLKTKDLCFVQRPQLPAAKTLSIDSTDVAFAPYGDYWRQMRKICSFELLSAKRVQSFSSIREDEVQKLIQSIQPQVEFNLSKNLNFMTSNIILRATFGRKSKYEDEFLSLFKEAMETAGGFDIADLFPSFKSIRLVTGIKSKFEYMKKKMDKILQNIVDEHRSNSKQRMQNQQQGDQENLVDVLLRVQQSDTLDMPITDNNIKAVIMEMFGVGSDTSTAATEWVVSELMKNPRAMKKAQAEIRDAMKGKKRINESDLRELRYLKSVIKESMRLHSTLLIRECREACNIGGYEIDVKTNVIINAWAIARDPKYWYDAEKFIPERFHDNIDFDFNKGNNNGFEYIPFGGGRRICPGIMFGLANVELPLAALLYHFDWKLPNEMKPDELDMTEQFLSLMSRKNNLWLIPTPYVSLE